MGVTTVACLLSAFLAQDPPPADGFQQATRLLRAGQVEAALPPLRQWCEAHPAPPTGWREAGRLLLVNQAAGPAVPFLEQAFRLAPADPEARTLLGSALLLSQQAQRAAELLREGTRLHPKEADLWFQAGMALAAAQRLLEASLCLEEAVRRQPAEPVFRFWAGDLHLRLHQWKEAEEDLSRAVGRADLVPDAGWKLASVLARRGADPEAERLFREVIQQEEQESRRRACFHLGVFLFERGREAEALPLLQRVVKEVPIHRTGWLYVGRCLQRLGRTDEAARAVARSRSLQEQEDDLETRRLLDQVRGRLSPPSSGDKDR